FSLLWSQSQSKKLKWLSLSCVVVTFLIHNIYIYRIKDHNYKAMQAIEQDIVNKMDQCPMDQACHIAIVDLAHDLKKDWTLPRDFWPAYLEWIRFRNRPSQAVMFDIVN